MFWESSKAYTLPTGVRRFPHQQSVCQLPSHYFKKSIVFLKRKKTVQINTRKSHYLWSTQKRCKKSNVQIMQEYCLKYTSACFAMNQTRIWIQLANKHCDDSTMVWSNDHIILLSKPRDVTGLIWDRLYTTSLITVNVEISLDWITENPKMAIFYEVA